jgi:hypothetical protein
LHSSHQHRKIKQKTRIRTARVPIEAMMIGSGSSDLE